MKKIKNFYMKLLLPFVSLIIISLFIGGCSNCPKCPTVVEPAVQQDCSPVKIAEFWKLELLKADYDVLRAASPGNGGALTFQFTYDKNATSSRLSLVAYSTKPGRDFQPPVLRYLNPLQVSTPAGLTNQFSLGDQYVRFGLPTGLDQLIAGTPLPPGTVFYSLVFTPELLTTNTTSGPPNSVTNIRYSICVKYRNAGGQFVEWCGAAASSTQPSPPANTQ